MKHRIPGSNRFSERCRIADIPEEVLDIDAGQGLQAGGAAAEYAYVAAAFEESFGKIRADEARAPGDQNALHRKVADTRSRNESSARSKNSGFSRLLMCPAPGTI